MKKFIGTGTALVTPFTEEKKVDYRGLEKLVRFNIDNGVDYLVVQGTTGESVTLSKEERIATYEFIVDLVKGKVPLVLGIGGNNTEKLLEELHWFDLSHVDAILSASPSYNKPSQEGIIAHYEAFAKEAPKPVILYNVPGRTGSNMHASTTLYLAKNDNIIAIKEASGNLDQVGQIIKQKPDDFLVISGDDALALPIIALGGAGVISVISNAFPGKFSTMVKLALENNYEEAREIHYQLIDIVYALFAENNPAGIKAALEIKNVCGKDVRLPLVNLSQKVYQSLQELMN